MAYSFVISPVSVQDFESEDELIERCKEWNLLSSTATRVKTYLYKRQGLTLPCEIVGYVDPQTVVIQFENKQQHCIHPAYLKEMQTAAFGSRAGAVSDAVKTEDSQTSPEAVMAGDRDGDAVDAASGAEGDENTQAAAALSVDTGAESAKTVVAGTEAEEAAGAKAEEAVVAGTNAEEAVAAGANAKEAVVAGTKAEEAVVARTKAEEAVAAGTKAEEAVAAGTKAEEAVAAGTKAEEAVAAGTKAEEAVAAGTKAEEAVAAGTKAEEAVAAGTKAEEAVAAGANAEEAVVAETKAAVAGEAAAGETPEAPKKPAKPKKKPALVLPDEKLQMTATVKEFTTVPNHFSDNDDEVIIYEGVTVEGQDLAIDEVWSSHSATLKKLELAVGDTLSFEAKVVAKKLTQHPVKYKINNPSKIKKLD